MHPILDIADLAQRREAAEATAGGAALFYAFGNVCALAARPTPEALRALGADEAPSVTTTLERGLKVFDWDRVLLPWSALVAVVADLQALGPIGIRGPAASWIPEYLTADDGTVQLLSPGDACPSNALAADILDLTGEEILAVAEPHDAAHYEMRGLWREYGERADAGFISHRNERANRRRQIIGMRQHVRLNLPPPLGGNLLLILRGAAEQVHLAVHELPVFEQVEEMVLADEVVKKWLDGSMPKRIVYVKNKMINVVI